MVHNKIHLINPGCPLPNIPFPNTIVAYNTIYLTYIYIHIPNTFLVTYVKLSSSASNSVSVMQYPQKCSVPSSVLFQATNRGHWEERKTHVVIIMKSEIFRAYSCHLYLLRGWGGGGGSEEVVALVASWLDCWSASQVIDPAPGT